MEVDDGVHPSTQLHGKNRRKTSQISRTQNRAKILRKSQNKKNGLHTWRQDSITKISYIDENQPFTRCGNHPNILSLFERFGRISHNLSTLLLHLMHTTPQKKAKSKPRCGGGMADVLTSPLILWVLFIVETKDKNTPVG
jgi:hypothetical protein